MRMESNTQAPPPTYQQEQQAPGQTYYKPPPAPEGGYAPPPPINNNMGRNGMGQRFTQFYSPPQNRKLGVKRRFCFVICCCIIIGLIVGLSAGLSTRSRNYYTNGYGSNNCNCRTNSDCTSVYGSGTYCYSGCQCARR